MTSFDPTHKNEKVTMFEGLVKHLPDIEHMRNPIKMLWNTDLAYECESENEQLLKLIDFSQLNDLFENFLAAIGLPVAIIDLNGTVLASSKWQRLCVEFHRINADTLSRCIESDRCIYAQLKTGEVYASHQCGNGLIDCATPIVIEGLHLANLFIGQFFVQPPNLDFFKQQQQLFGFDEIAYFEAIAEVPVINEERLPSIMALLAGWAQQIAARSLAEKRTLAALSSVEQLVKERTEQLANSHTLLQTAQHAARMGHYVTDLATGTWTNDALFDEIFGIDSQFPLDFANWQRIVHPDDIQRVLDCFEQATTNHEAFPIIEYRITRPSDGALRWIATWGHNFYDDEGNAIQRVGMVQDITDYKHAQLTQQEALERLQKIASLVPGMVYQFRLFADGSSCFPYSSEGVRTVFRVQPAQVLESSAVIFSCIHPDDYQRVIDSIQQSAQNLTTWLCEFRVCFEAGTEVRWLSGNSVPQREEGGSTLWHGFITDITDRKLSEQKLQKREQQLQLVLEGGHLGFWDWNIITNEVQRNAIWAEMLGYSHEEIQQTTQQWTDFIYPDDRDKAWQSIHDVLDGFVPYHEVEYRMLHKDGSIVWILDHASIVQRDANGKPMRMSGTHTDITKLKKLETDLRASEERFRTLFTKAPLGIAVIDSITGHIYNANQKYADIVGLTIDELQGVDWMQITHPDDVQADLDNMALMNAGKTNGFSMEKRYIRPDGSIVWINLTVARIQIHERGHPCHHCIVEDITARKISEEHIKQLASYDPLTQLANRRLLQEHLKHGIEVSHRANSQMAVLILDLDKFKAVNDNLGHAAGDELLQQVAKRIKIRLREMDLVARLGGDEFVVLIEDVSHYEYVAYVANDIIDALSQPFTLRHNHEVIIGTSIGIAMYPQHGNTAEALMDNADTALYHAKDNGRGCFAYFSDELTQKARERINLEKRLRRAIEQEELRVYFQPQIDIHSGQIVGAEALIRWYDPIEGCLTPNSFIALAEETGLIVTIGEWVLRETCRLGQQWLVQGLPPVTLAVNVSPCQFRRCDMNALVTKVLRDTGFPVEYLELEITESGLMDNQYAMSILDNLHEQGVHLAIDDFGTGYSSLAYLKYFPVDVLKIDKTFIDDIPNLQGDMAITATIIAMAHHLGFKVLAEGVETQEQLAFLRAQGCDMYQGYLYSKALPADDFFELLMKSNQLSAS